MANEDLLKEELALEEQLLSRQLDEQPGGMETAGVTALVRFVDNILGIPQGTGELLATGAGGLQSLFGGPPLQEAIAQQREQPPASALLSVPRVRTQDIAAGVQSLSPDVSFEQAQLAQEQSQRQLEEQRPAATTTGNVIGDVATMLTLRAPFAKRLGRIPRSAPVKQKEIIPTGMLSAANRAIRSKSVQRLLRGIGRAGETSLEGAVLGALAEGDPVDLAVFGAGGQLAGSLALEGTKGVFVSSGDTIFGKLGKTGLKFTAAALSVAGLVQVLNEATPGGKDFILESIETGYEKVTLFLVLGALAGAGGAGRLRGKKISEELPKLMDAVTAVPRNGVLSVLKEITSAGAVEQQDMENVMLKALENPEFFESDARSKLLKAIENPDVSFRDTLGVLARDQEFQRKLEAIRQERQQSPLGASQSITGPAPQSP